MRDQFEKAVNAEVKAQIRVWGEQNHPSVDQTLMNRPGGASAQRMADEYEIPTAMRAKFMCETAAQRGELTWTHIALEEFCEAVEAFTINPNGAPYELIQLEAVVRNWRMSVERNS